MFCFVQPTIQNPIIFSSLRKEMKETRKIFRFEKLKSAFLP